MPELLAEAKPGYMGQRTGVGEAAQEGEAQYQVKLDQEPPEQDAEQAHSTSQLQIVKIWVEHHT